ncbi:muconolactone Delta-isomerase family protein, partial [Acinetobacter baumannii]
MLFHVRMDVHIPLEMPADQANDSKAGEKAYSQEVPRQGKWRHIW